jgi:hypothetical protein
MTVDVGVPSMWRYAAMLPLHDVACRITLGEGWTPLIDVPGMAKAIGCGRLLVKDEGGNPSGSFKDRSASWTISRLREQGAAGVVLHSTGNAGAAFATFAALAGMACVSIVPSDVLDTNLEQMRMAGARIEILDVWTEAPARAASLAASLGYADVSSGRTTRRAEGKRTLAVENRRAAGLAVSRHRRVSDRRRHGRARPSPGIRRPSRCGLRDRQAASAFRQPVCRLCADRDGVPCGRRDRTPMAARRHATRRDADSVAWAER